MPKSDPQLLVSTEWLATHMSAPDLRILDASWYLPAEGRDPKEEYAAKHIPGARFFDIDDYDGMGVFSAARVWWLFRLMGKTDVAVLDGGLPKWIKDGHPTEDMAPSLRDRHFTAQRNAGLVKDVTQVAASVKLGDAQILDARSPDRFSGKEQEVRPGLRSGHMPGALNIHFRTLLGRLSGSGRGERRIDRQIRGFTIWH